MPASPSEKLMSQQHCENLAKGDNIRFVVTHDRHQDEAAEEKVRTSSKGLKWCLGCRPITIRKTRTKERYPKKAHSIPGSI